MLVSKVLLSAFVIVSINLLAKRYPALGGYVAVLPVITFLSLITLTLDKQSNKDISMFLNGALAGVALTSLVLIFMLFMVRSGLPISYVILLGMSAWVIVAFSATRVFT